MSSQVPPYGAPIRPGGFPPQYGSMPLQAPPDGSFIRPPPYGSAPPPPLPGSQAAAPPPGAGATPVPQYGASNQPGMVGFRPQYGGSLRPPPPFQGMAPPSRPFQGPGVGSGQEISSFQANSGMPAPFQSQSASIQGPPQFQGPPPSFQSSIQGPPSFQSHPSSIQGQPPQPFQSHPQAPPQPLQMQGPPLQPPQFLSRPPGPGYSQMPPPPGQNWRPSIGDNLQQPGSPSTTPSQRIDPSQIPRPQPSFATSVYDTVSSGPIPPSSTSDFYVRDAGNCSPRIMRSTLYQVPCTADLLNTSKMPLALIIQPLALPHVNEEPIKVVDFGESGPVRCNRCKAYINSFMKFIDQGRRFVCNICGHTNETPRDYVCNLGPDGRRRDADDRPELSRGTVEFVATQEYLLRPPMPPVFFFLVDVSANAIKTGAAAAACSAIQRVLADIAEGPRTMVGVATFDSTIHFYNLSKDLQQPSMLVVPDIQDVYVPVENGLVVPVAEGREHMETLLENIPNMFHDNVVQESALGAAMKGSFLALKPTGGKLLVFQSVLPSIGLGALTPREAEARDKSAEAHKVLQPADKTLKAMAEEFSSSQVCVDLFLTTQTYVDIASLSVVPITTGGQAYYYFPFSATMDSAKLYNDLRWNLTRPQGLEAVMRVRCSQGIKVQDYFGSCKRVTTDVDLPAIDCDKSILVTFKHEDKFQEGADCCFQSALLYTTVDGHRRIRVSTLSLTCTNVLSNLFKGADLDAQFTYLLKTAAQGVPVSPLSQVREQTIGQCVQSLFSYRKFCATASSSGQLILPECLKLLPLYTLALTKSVGLRQDVRVDERAYWLMRATSISASLAIPLVYPRLFSVHNIPKLDESSLPPTLPLSSENLDPEGIFLLETGEDAFLYAGKAVSSELLHQLFEVRSVNEVIPGQFLLQEYDNEPSILLNKMVNEIRRQRCSYLRLHLLKRGDPLEMMFHSFMIEDKSGLGSSYVEFLVYVHRQIQVKMQSGS
ncbi:protein transport protein Sec24-like At4g32640 [Selaginella moellendorffii]|uniref:protein transport protein Sec24-like At4g32640 n=1 Tax=Selaginella moellendorffii TaxID=88036 RepID=UPI000D1C5C31|nr:protein transport protein Sec24-like At4g32640 [Selaginella moellendorffii]|eukprot:XP_024531752.1 protein transport protein Sec24-like At4g32640 [Selaginella moellendorffii]